jgi:hypothetical protein
MATTIHPKTLLIQSPSGTSVIIAYTEVTPKANSYKISTMSHANGGNKPIQKPFVVNGETNSAYIKVKIGSEGLTRDVRDFLDTQNTMREILIIKYDNIKISAMLEEVPEITFPQGEMEITFLEVSK